MTSPSHNATHQIPLDLNLDPTASGYVPIPDADGGWPSLQGSETSPKIEAAGSSPAAEADSSPYIQAHLALEIGEGNAHARWDEPCAPLRSDQPSPGSQSLDPSLDSPYLIAPGTLLLSPGGHFTYRILGACCRLFDREELPWPCCRLQWRSKEPSWRRIGKRFVPDLATKRSPSYAVEIVDHDYAKKSLVVTLYWIRLPEPMQNWWYRRYVPDAGQQR